MAIGTMERVLRLQHRQRCCEDSVAKTTSGAPISQQSGLVFPYIVNTLSLPKYHDRFFEAPRPARNRFHKLIRMLFNKILIYKNFE